MSRLNAFLMSLLAISLLVAGCSEGESPHQAISTPADGLCTVSVLELGPEGFAPYGLARAGSVWFSAFSRVDPGAPATLAGTGPYDGWKVVIHPDPKAFGTASVSGVQCSSQKPVRFCYGGCNWDDRLNALSSWP